MSEPSAKRPGWISALSNRLRGENNLLVNYFSLLSGTVSSKAMAFIVVLMLTRYLGVEDFGRYSLLLSFWALLNTLVDVGAGAILGREIAKDPQNPRPYVESVIYLRLMACILVIPVAYALAPMLGITPYMLLVAYLGLFVAFEAFYDVYFSATMQLQKSAATRFFSSWMNLLLVGMAVLLKWPLVAVVAIALGTPLLKLWLDYRYIPIQWKLHAPDWEVIRRFAKDGWPLWLMGILYIVLARIDTLLLVMLSPGGSGNIQLGIYSAAFRFSEVMALLINAVSPSILPLLVAHMENHDRIRFLTGKGMRLILVVLMTLTLMVFWFAPWIVRIYGAGYNDAAACMQVLIWSQAMVAVNTLCYQLLVIYNVQGRWPVLLSGVIVVLVNIGSNLWLIPEYRALGASWATVITEFFAALTMLFFIRKYTPNRLFKDVMLVEALALIACLPAFYWGGQYGWSSIGLFLLLVLGCRVLTLDQVKQLMREKLS